MSSSSRPLRARSPSSPSTSRTARIEEALSMAIGSSPTPSTPPGNSAARRRHPSAVSPSVVGSLPFEPQLVRGTVGRSPQQSMTPSRVRRASAGAASMLAHASSVLNSPTPHHASQAAAAFPAPSYLPRSLRFVAESPPLVPPAAPWHNTTLSASPSNYATSSHRQSASHGSPSTMPWAYRVRSQGPPDGDSDDDSDVSVNAGDGHDPRASRVSRPPLLHPANDPIYLPSRWSQTTHHSLLNVSSDGRELTFQGEFRPPSNEGEKCAAAARADYPIPLSCGIYYYEVEVLNRGREGHISIGFAAKSVKLTRLPGWERNSWGYHGDDGKSFASEKNGTPFGPKFTAGDIIGCGVDFTAGEWRSFFTKNGAWLGYAFDPIHTSETELYPSIGLRTIGESIRANFGQEKFKFDISLHVAQQRQRVWKTVQSTPLRWAFREVNPGSSRLEGDARSSKELPVLAVDAVSLPPQKPLPVDPEASIVGPAQAESDMSRALQAIVLNYLTHHGYSRAAHALHSHLHYTLDSRSRGKGKARAVDSMDLDDDIDADGDPDDDNDPLALTQSIEMGFADADESTYPTFDAPGPGMRHDEVRTRQRIVMSVLRGDIDTALGQMEAHYPGALSRDQNLLRIKLRCRQFVELVLGAAEASKQLEKVNVEGSSAAESMEVDGISGADGVSIPIPAGYRRRSPSRNPAVEEATAAYEKMLAEALAFGQTLQSDYKTDSRPSIQALVKRSFGLVMFGDPLSCSDSTLITFAGQPARDQLASEVQEAILESQGRPAQPALERVYRQSIACLQQLASLGTGTAAFIDVRKELFEE